MTARYAYAIANCKWQFGSIEIGCLACEFSVNFTFILCQHQLNDQPFFLKKNNIGVASCS